MNTWSSRDSRHTVEIGPSYHRNTQNLQDTKRLEYAWRLRTPRNTGCFRLQSVLAARSTNGTHVDTKVFGFLCFSLVFLFTPGARVWKWNYEKTKTPCLEEWTTKNVICLKLHEIVIVDKGASFTVGSSLSIQPRTNPPKLYSNSLSFPRFRSTNMTYPDP